MSFINSIWYGKGITAFLAKLPLLPFSGMFGIATAVRRAMYAHGLLKKEGPVVPVVVIGGITAGGTGKTPTCIALVKELQSRGFRPGVLSRGYKGQLTEFPSQVPLNCDPAIYGDEPSLIRAATKVPVVVDPVRSRGADYLAGLGVDVIILDDGLQHYALDRDVEICVLDGSRMLGNGHLMPAGPLRESLWRLKTVDSVVVTGAIAHLGYFPMILKQSSLDPVNSNSHESLVPGAQVCAFSGIGNPDRFYKTLEDYGFIIKKTVDVGDHNRASLDTLKELSSELPVVMTAKDAIKYRKEIEEHNLYNIFVLNVQAQLSKQFFDDVVSKIKQSSYKVAERRRKRERNGYTLERVKAIEVVKPDNADKEIARDSYRSLNSRAVIKSIINDKKGSISAMDLYRAEKNAAISALDAVSEKKSSEDNLNHSLTSESGQHVLRAKLSAEELRKEMQQHKPHQETDKETELHQDKEDKIQSSLVKNQDLMSDHHGKAKLNESNIQSIDESSDESGEHDSLVEETRNESKTLRKQIKSRIDRHEAANLYKLEVANDSSETDSYESQNIDAVSQISVKTGTDADDMVDVVSEVGDKATTNYSEHDSDEVRGASEHTTSSRSWKSSRKFEDNGKDIFGKKEKPKTFDPQALPRELRRKSK